jgi:hypothetical protein
LSTELPVEAVEGPSDRIRIDKILVKAPTALNSPVQSDDLGDRTGEIGDNESMGSHEASSGYVLVETNESDPQVPAPESIEDTPAELVEHDTCRKTKEGRRIQNGRKC